MSDPINLLLLGGTGEAVDLAARLADDTRLRVVTSLAGRTINPIRPCGESRIGGFGGTEGLERYLADQRVDLLIDATHPFAATISAHAAAACSALGVPRLVLARDPWRSVPGDRWIEVGDVAAAADALTGLARRVFLTVGRRDLEAFATANGVWFLVRLIDQPPHPLPLRDCVVIAERGPFSVEHEQKLLVQHRIEALIAKNSGGAATYAKIVAARDMGLPVIMIRPPAPPAGDRVTTVAAAIEWVRRRL